MLRPKLTFHVISVFPEPIRAYTTSSILGRARKAKRFRAVLHNLWDHVKKGERVDGRPYGGGPGMVLRAEPIMKALGKIKSQTSKGKNKGQKSKVIIFSPRGKQFTQVMAKKWAKENRDLVLIAGRYEGVDARVKKMFRAEEISIGPYVLSGGEVPAMAVIDAVARHLPGVLGKNESLEENRVASGETYTRPASLKHAGRVYRVPKLLLSGHHAKIKTWRAASSK